MSVTFTFKTIDATDALVFFAAFEGDNEVCVYDAGSNGDDSYGVLVVNHGDPLVPCEIVREEFTTLQGALARVVEFMRAEYEV